MKENSVIQINKSVDKEWLYTVLRDTEREINEAHRESDKLSKKITDLIAIKIAVQTRLSYIIDDANKEERNAIHQNANIRLQEDSKDTD